MLNIIHNYFINVQSLFRNRCTTSSNQTIYRPFGLDLVTRLCERLLAGGAPGLHFYSMNQAELTLEICRRLGRG